MGGQALWGAVREPDGVHGMAREQGLARGERVHLGELRGGKGARQARMIGKGRGAGGG